MAPRTKVIDGDVLVNGGISPNDVLAIRQADAAVVLSQVKGSQSGGFSFADGKIRCVKRNTDRVFGSTEQERWIAVPSMVEAWDQAEVDWPTLDCFEMVHSPGPSSYNEEWRTFAEFIKPGDRLELRWWRGKLSKSDDYLTSAGLVLDKVSIRVVRGKKTFRFHVGESITPSPCTARLTRDARDRL